MISILVLYGSPHRTGTTKKLAEHFLDGIKDEQFKVQEIWLDGEDINQCKGCGFCKSHDGKCVQQDDMQKIYPMLLKADLIVFASPLYYFGFTAQLKVCIDRFFAMNTALRKQEKKTVLLTAGNSEEDWIMDGILANYRVMLKYMHWQSAGEVCAIACGNAASLETTDYSEQAEKLGRLCTKLLS